MVNECQERTIEQMQSNRTKAIKMTNSSELVLHKTKMEETAARTNKSFSLKDNKKLPSITSPNKHKSHRIGSSHRHKQLSKPSSLLSLRANLGLVFLTFILYFTYNHQSVEACLCHLIPNFQCPPPPHCCESGLYTKDECGCCLTCAKTELQPCGGPSGAHGKCASGLQCLKTCTACTTLSSSKREPCVFPFVYDGVEYNKCTSIDAANPGNVWCATEVDPEYNNTVIDGRWGDCAESCPGARRECNDRRFEIIVGKCINPQVPGAIPNWFGAPAIRLLEKTEQLFPAPFCSSKGRSSKSRPKYKNTCHCAEGQDAFEITTDGTVRGNCTGVDSNRNDDQDPVWCFLENVRDPSNSKSGCYSDTRWSSKDGRFWSARACDGLPPIEANDVIEVDPSALINSAFRQSFVRPDKFSKPRELPRSFDRPTTERPRPTTTRRTTTGRTTRRPIDSVTPLNNIFADDGNFDDEDIDGDLTDHLVATNRVAFRNRNQFREKPTPTTTETQVEFGGRLFKSTDVEGSSDDGGFGSRQTTTGAFDLQKIEDDYGANGNGEDFPEENRSSRVFDGGPAIGNIDYNDADLDYLYDYYNGEDAYDDSFTSLNARNRQKLRQEGSSSTKNTLLSQKTPNQFDNNNKDEDKILADLVIVNQRENGIEFFPTPATTNTRKFTRLTTARDFPATETDPFIDHSELDSSKIDGEDPPPLTTAKTDYPGQPTTPSPFVFGAKLSDAKARFANRFKLNRRGFLNDIKEQTGSIKFVNTKRNRAKINHFKRRRPIQEETEDYDDPEPRPTARTTLGARLDPAPRPTRRPDARKRVTEESSAFIDDTDPEPATTVNPPKGILNQAIAQNKRRIKSQILKQKKEISRGGVIPPRRKIILLNRKQVLEAKNAQLEAKPKKEFRIIDAEELFDRLKEKNAPTTSTATTPTSATENENNSVKEFTLDNTPIEQQETITASFAASSIATTVSPIFENVPSLEAAFKTVELDLEEGSVDFSTPKSTITLPTSSETDYTSTIQDTTTKQSAKLPSSNLKLSLVENTPNPSSSTKIEQPLNAHKSLGEILAALPKEKLEKFKKYLLTLNKKDKKLISNTLKNNLEAARKSFATTASPDIRQNNDAVIDLGILGSFHLEKPKRTIFEDELFDNRIRAERPSPVFRLQ